MYAGIWNGGISYSHGDAGDAEIFNSIEEAREEIRARRAGHGDFAFIFKGHETWVATPAAHDDNSGYVDLYAINPEDVETSEGRDMIRRAIESGEMDLRLEIGPRGGIVQSGPAPMRESAAARKAREEEARREGAASKLREIFPQGATVAVSLAHVSASGMQRGIKVLAATADGVEDVSWLAARVTGWPLHDKGGVKVDGAGMDMGFHVVYVMAQTMYRDGYALKHRWV